MIFVVEDRERRKSTKTKRKKIEASPSTALPSSLTSHHITYYTTAVFSSIQFSQLIDCALMMEQSIVRAKNAQYALRPPSKLTDWLIRPFNSFMD